MPTATATSRTDARAYQKARQRAKARSAVITLAGQDIAPIPPVANPARRARADGDFKFFCETYFPHLFTLAWSTDHLQVIAKIQRVVRRHETLAVAMPRGSGKTTLCLVAVIWAVLSGQHQYVMLIASAQEAALGLLASIKTHLESNADLLADYPEAIYPIRRLENESRCCVGQRYQGVLTRIGWGVDELVLPTIPGSRCSGAVIRVAGLTGNIRGALFVRPNGTQVRPTLAVCDDPQTDQSARSLIQTAERLAIINGAVKGLAGPGKRTAIIIPCTVIQPEDMADQLLNRELNPEWHGERTQLIRAFPTNAKLWAEYARLRNDSLRTDGDGREATEFYRQHRATCDRPLDEAGGCEHCAHAVKCMDAGAIVSWPARHGQSELTAVQFAQNLRMANERAFFAEFQNAPLPSEGAGDPDALKPEQIRAKTNGLKRGLVPIGSNHLTAFIDVQAKLLFWLVTAWEEDFTGYVIDYGAYPEQRRPYFTAKDAKRTLAMLARGTGLEGSIYAGLEKLTDELLGRAWHRDDGAAMHIERCLIDANWGESTDVIYQFCRQTKHAALVQPSHGRFVGASSKPFAEYERRPGETMGFHWRMPRVGAGRQVRHIIVDTNYWKSFAHARLAVAMGDRGCLSLFGADPEQHRMLAEHLTAEYRVPTTAQGRTVDEWKQRPHKPENHWLDCLVGCAAAASMVGVSLPGMEAKLSRRRKRYTQEDLRRRW